MKNCLLLLCLLPPALLPGWGMASAAETTAPTAGGRIFYIEEYRVRGAHILPRVEVEKAVYPFMGPGRSEQDVEQARAALEKAYRDRGYQTVEVQIPPQTGRGGLVFLQVIETRVGRLRVRGSRYFLPSEIRQLAPSLAEGKVVDFNAVTRDILTLNQLPDRRVTPSLRAGIEPGTVDIDLDVKDTFPLHGSLELNNRFSANTSPLRLNGSLSYNNLWQLGHSAGLSFQLAPEDSREAKVISGFYLTRFAALPAFSWIVQGTRQDSNVSTLGGAAVLGKGEIIGTRVNLTLPPGQGFYHSVSLGLDYKHFDQTINLATGQILSPISYYPVSASYSASWIGKTSQTELNGGVTWSFRGAGSGEAQFSDSRFQAGGNFIYLRADLSHTHELPYGWQAYGKIQGQIADQPLVSAEQFSAGGVGTARGYLEAEVPGDNALFGTAELRSFNFLAALPWLKDRGNGWRVYAFVDSGFLSLRDPLPGQDSHFDLASVGLGTHLELAEHYNASIDLAMPLIGQAQSRPGDVRLNFRLWADF